MPLSRNEGRNICLHSKPKFSTTMYKQQTFFINPRSTCKLWQVNHYQPKLIKRCNESNIFPQTNKNFNYKNVMEEEETKNKSVMNSSDYFNVQGPNIFEIMKLAESSKNENLKEKSYMADKRIKMQHKKLNAKILSLNKEKKRMVKSILKIDFNQINERK